MVTTSLITAYYADNEAGIKYINSVKLNILVDRFYTSF